MIRIAGVNLDEKKQVRFALSIIKGVGKNNVKIILDTLKIDPTTKMGALTDSHIQSIRSHIDENYTVEADLTKQTKEHISRLIRIGSWRGLRHKAGMPVHGQTTRTNSRTVRGNVRKTAGSGRAKSAEKT